MEAFLEVLLPELLPRDCSFNVRVFNGKPDLLRKLGARLRGYEKWLPDDYRLVVLVDRDRGDCRALKDRLEKVAYESGLVSCSTSEGKKWQIANRIVIEELESWYFGDWSAVCAAYPRLSPGTPKRARFRDPDAILGGTAEAFERVMQRHGYFPGGLNKLEAARSIARHFQPEANVSRSFEHFRAVLCGED